MPRMNISISDALRERMDEHENVNWSAVAQAAFELEIKSKIKGYGDMEKVIDRLRASKQRIETEVKPMWIGYGAEFASNDAEYDELERIAEINPDYIIDDSTGVELLKAIIAAKIDARPDGRDIMEFLESTTGEPDTKISRVKVEWMLEGINDVWSSVKDII